MADRPNSQPLKKSNLLTMDKYKERMQAHGEKSEKRAQTHHQERGRSGQVERDQEQEKQKQIKASAKI